MNSLVSSLCLGALPDVRGGVPNKDCAAPLRTGTSPSSNGLTPSIHATLKPNRLGLLRR